MCRKVHEMTKRRTNYTISTDLLDRLDKYIERRKGIMGAAPSRSNIVEEALAKHLIKLEEELHSIDPSKGKREISVSK